MSGPRFVCITSLAHKDSVDYTCWCREDTQPVGLLWEGKGPGATSIFERIELGEDIVALRQRGLVLQARDGSVCLEPVEIGEWETFREIRHGNGEISFQTHERHLIGSLTVRTDEDGFWVDDDPAQFKTVLIARADTVSTSERWCYVEPERAVLEAFVPDELGAYEQEQRLAHGYGHVEDRQHGAESPVVVKAGLGQEARRPAKGGIDPDRLHP